MLFHESYRTYCSFSYYVNTYIHAHIHFFPPGIYRVLICLPDAFAFIIFRTFTQMYLASDCARNNFESD